MHTSSTQLRGLFLAVSSRTEELSISHRGLGAEVPGEAGQGVNSQLCLSAGGVCMCAPKGREAQFIHACNGPVYPDTLSWELAMCVHTDWDRDRKGQGKMHLYWHLLEVCGQVGHATRFLRYVVIPVL